MSNVSVLNTCEIIINSIHTAPYVKIGVLEKLSTLLPSVSTQTCSLKAKALTFSNTVDALKSGRSVYLLGAWGLAG